LGRNNEIRGKTLEDIYIPTGHSIPQKEEIYYNLFQYYIINWLGLPNKAPGSGAQFGGEGGIRTPDRVLAL
jgi:hypothetical protein